MMLPSEIYKLIDKRVKGQEQAKKIISVAIYDHYVRCSNPDLHLKKSNILMIGPSGCGKTYLIETVSELFDIPMAVADATSLTQAGYVGEDVENCLIQLLNNANGNIELAQKGIVFIDEIDKLARHGVSNTGGRDISGEGVQQSLLKLIEGAKIQVKLSNGIPSESVWIDTTNILFVCAGAFEDMEENYRYTLAQSLFQYGMIRELIGRLHIIVRLDKLSEQTMYQILSDCENNIIEQYQNLFKYSGYELDIGDDALKLLSKYASANPSGARSLRTFLEHILLPYQFNFSNNDAPYDMLQHIHITEINVVSSMKDFK